MDSLQLLPMEKWTDIQDFYKTIWPDGIAIYSALETQKEIFDHHLDYGFKVYCPYGNMVNGVVAINLKSDFYEVFIDCVDDTSVIEAALIETKLIDWNRPIILPFTRHKVIDAVARAVERVDAKIVHVLPSRTFLLESDTPLYENTTLPQGISFRPLTLEHLNLIDSVWPHRYGSSPWYFQLLINAGFSYALYEEKKLVCWVFISEVGPLTHMYTIESYRRRGYGELLLKLVCNQMLRNKRHMLVYCVNTNLTAINMYQKLKFKEIHEVAWCYLDKKV